MVPIAVFQVICANFFAPATGTYGDHCPVMVTGTTTTATAHGVTGFQLGTTAGTECTTYATGQTVARIDFQVVGVDPGDQVTFEMNGAAFPLETADLAINPDVTAQPLMASGGVVTSAGMDGSAYFEMGAYLTSFEFCVEAPAGHDGVVIRPIIQAFCQCGNGHKHYNEDCDDGDMTSGDGCSDMCGIEPGWSCTGVYDQPSVCTTPPDAGVPDAGPPPDAAVPDAAVPDAMPAPDAAVPDAAVPDAGAFDAMPPIEADAAPDDDAAVPGDPDAGDNLPPIPPARGCGCQGGADPAGLALGLLSLALLRRRRCRVRI
jgi:uncharacterized protein (TIGR03382 family)